MYKVHWIIDGIANVEKKDQVEAEKEIKSLIEKSFRKTWKRQ